MLPLPRLALLALLVSSASAASPWTISTFAGTGAAGNGGDGDPLACALNRLHGVFVDADGSVFIGDSEGHRVRVLRKK